MADTLGTLNPLTCRGYVYDQETQLYYVSSRYYNPAWGRFLNADALVSTGQGFLGNNMFAYCRNNPVCRKDILGTTDVEIFGDNSNLLDDDESIHGGKMGNGESGGGGNSAPGGQVKGSGGDGSKTNPYIGGSYSSGLSSTNETGSNPQYTPPEGGWRCYEFNDGWLISHHL